MSDLLLLGSCAAIIIGRRVLRVREMVMNVAAIERLWSVYLLLLLLTCWQWLRWQLMQSINVLPLMCDRVQGVDLATITRNRRFNC